jgi:putative glutamine amidotransferase
VTGRPPIVAVSQGLADYGEYYGFGYGRVLLAAGALPLLLTYYEGEDERAAVLERVGGLVLAGGRDIEAWRYGRTRAHPKQGEGLPHLDEIELSYAHLAIDNGVPVMGVCRGLQVLNVALGGTLYGDLDEFPEGGADHPGAKWAEWRALVAATLEGRTPPPHPVHPIEVKPGSLLSGFLGERYVVDSYHHQAVDRVGDGLEPVAWAPHGVVEALEMPGSASFLLGVQWEIHEEWQSDERMLGIWRAFVEAARERMRAREGARVSP